MTYIHNNGEEATEELEEAIEAFVDFIENAPDGDFAGIAYQGRYIQLKIK